MHEKCDFNEKKKVKETYLSLMTKTLERFVEENDKKKAQIGPLEEKQ